MIEAKLIISLRRHGRTLWQTFVLLALLCSTPLSARTFTPVGASNGLEARVAASMIVDQNGFLWVGSKEGLFRYDGYSTQAFLPESANADSISDIDIRYIYEAVNGEIWIGTNTGGLNVYNPETGKFKTYRNNSTNPASILDDSVYGIAEGPEKGLWVSTQKGLSRLDRETGFFEHFLYQQDNEKSLSHNWTFSLYLGKSGVLWISTIGGGVNRWNPRTRDFTRYDLAALTSGPAKRNDVFSLYEGSDGRVWAGTREGMVILDPETSSAEFFPMGEQDGYLPGITSIVADDQERLWLGTLIRGVLIIDMANMQWMPSNPDPLGAVGYLPAQPQMSLVIGGDQIFVGTWGSGVYRAPLNEPGFALLNRANTGEKLRLNSISAIMATNETGRPWLGSFGGGPQHFDIRSHTLLSKSVQEPMADSAVLDMSRDMSGTFFAATSTGLFRFNEDGSSISQENYVEGKPGGLGKGYVYSLLPSPDNNMWVGLAGSGLYYRNGETGEYTVYVHDTDVPDSLSGDFVTTLVDGQAGFIWVGTRSNGLNRCRIENWSCERFSGRSDSESSLSHFHITALYKDRRGRLWVGTDGGGLNRVLQEENGEVKGFERWGSEDGLLNDGIMAIEEDVDESLWLSTRHGLSRVNPMTGQVVNFVSDSGLPVSHFNTNASAADTEYIYFGSVDGLIRKKGSLLEARHPAAVKVTRVQRAAKGQHPEVILAVKEGIRAPYGDVITVEFAVIDYSESSHEYAYRLNPEDSWTDLDSQRQIIFHGLSPGRYTFQARGRDIYGLWGESAPLLLTVVPPFWMTTWFRLLMAFMILSAGISLHLLRAATVRRRAQEIQRLSQRRERALEEVLGGEAELAVLTPRQKEILQLIAEGQTTRSISEILGVSIKTVEAHRANLMERLQIHDVPGLVRLAVRSRLVSPHD
jgi:ligand-binding sensor domain-containing protein/DNA-binding CsgD family transcriptional regulator